MCPEFYQLPTSNLTFFFFKMFFRLVGVQIRDIDLNKKACRNSYVFKNTQTSTVFTHLILLKV